MRTKGKKNNVLAVLKYTCLALVLAVVIIGTVFLLPDLLRFAEWYFGAGMGFNMLLLYIGTFTLEAVALILLFLFVSDDEEMPKETDCGQENAREVLAVEVRSAVQGILRAPNDVQAMELSGVIYDLCVRCLPEAQNLLEKDLLQHLVKIMNLLKQADRAAAQEGSEAARHLVRRQMNLISKPWVHAVANSEYVKRLSYVKDYNCLLNKTTRRLLSALFLKEEGSSIQMQEEVEHVNGKKLFVVHLGNSLVIYDDNEAVLFDGTLADCGVDGRYTAYNGWAKTVRYTGELRNGEYHGHGCTYDSLGIHKYQEGLWEHGQFVTGIAYDLLLKRIAGNRYKLYGYYWDCAEIVQNSETGLDEAFYVADCEVDHGYKKYCRVTPYRDFTG